jgi:lipoprotein-anchoring transpeptidase ErfK/SrfK
VRRSGLALLFVLGFALAGGASAAVREDPPPPTTTTTTPAPTTTTPPTTTVVPPPAQVLPAGVKVGGVPVGGLTPTAAFLALQDALPETLALSVGKTSLTASRAQLGAVDYLWNAISKAKTVSAGTNVPIATAVKGSAVRAYLAKLAQRFDRPPVDAELRLRKTKPVVTSDAPGFRLQLGPAAAAVVEALTTHQAGPVELPAKVLEPAVTRGSFGPVIVIRRAANQLDLYRGMKPWRQFAVATGQKIYPTPLGKFQIVAMWKNPWWYPPNSTWAAGEKPVPPGPGNPLGTRWMGISSPGVGIHGTPDSASLGYSASHGCIRMAIPQAEWLFNHIAVGTPVYIVAS